MLGERPSPTARGEPRCDEHLVLWWRGQTPEQWKSEQRRGPRPVLANRRKARTGHVVLGNESDTVNSKGSPKWQRPWKDETAVFGTRWTIGQKSRVRVWKQATGNALPVLSSERVGKVDRYTRLRRSHKPHGRKRKKVFNRTENLINRISGFAFARS